MIFCIEDKDKSKKKFSDVYLLKNKFVLYLLIKSHKKNIHLIRVIKDFNFITFNLIYI